MHPLPCHITRSTSASFAPRGGPSASDSERRLRIYFGFENPRYDLAWSSLLRFDASMGSPPFPDPYFAQALAHPQGSAALSIALASFSSIDFLMEDARRNTERFANNIQRAALERRRQQAACDAISLGLSIEQEASLARHAFCTSAFDALSRNESFSKNGRLDPLGSLCGALGTPLPNLGSNAILADLAVGCFGAWLYQEATDAAKPKESKFYLGFRGTIFSEPPLAQWACSLMETLRESWDFQSPLFDQVHAQRLMALGDFAQACSAADGRPDPVESRWLSYFEARQIGEALRSPSPSDPHRASRL